MSTPIPAFDPEFPRCRAHRSSGPGEVSSCPACAEARQWVLDRREAALLASAARTRGCDMCDAVGVRWDPRTHTPWSPATTCDHTTSHDEVVAAAVASDKAAQVAGEQLVARAARARAEAVGSTAEHRARMFRMFAEARGRRAVPAQRGEVNPSGPAQPGHVKAESVA
ncbi:MAG: hypothetical protein JWO67_6241 [Streptosporangiaceae bacterium]|nr:hypothetical protein [Streptosporangiaceae bacterium]